MQAHLAQAVKERPRVLEHDAGLLPLLDELGNELSHALVTPMENAGIVIVADAGVLHHVLEIADHGGGSKLPAARRDQRLVHVQRDRERAASAIEIDAAFVQE